MLIGPTILSGFDAGVGRINYSIIRATSGESLLAQDWNRLGVATVFSNLGLRLLPDDFHTRRERTPRVKFGITT